MGLPCSFTYINFCSTVLFYLEKITHEQKRSITLKNYKTTRMHSSRMRTVRCSSRLSGGVSAQGEGCLPSGGVCLEKGGVCPGGVSLWGVCLGGGQPGEVSAQEVSTQGVVCLGGCLPGGVCKGGLPNGECLLGGVCQPPLDRMTDMCKNITLPQLRSGR